MHYQIPWGETSRFAARAVALTGLLLLPLITTADQHETPAAGRSPGDMTVEERREMMQGVADYNGCVYKEAMARVEALPDIRQAADQAMEACKPTIEKLKTTIEKQGFEAGFAEQFTHHTQSRAVKTLLPELALRKGSN